MCLAYDEPDGTAAGFASTRGAVRLVCRFPGRVRFTTRKLSETRQEMRTQLADGTLAAIAEAGPATTRVRRPGRQSAKPPRKRRSRLPNAHNAKRRRQRSVKPPAQPSAKRRRRQSEKLPGPRRWRPLHRQNAKLW